MKKRKAKVKKTHGDVLRINVTPWKGKKSKTFPWVRVFRHPHGIRHAAEIKGLEEGPAVGESKADFAKRLGMGIIRKSKILRKWFR
jgi:hypothetical protein